MRYIQNQKSNFHSTRGITRKRVTSDWTHLRGLAPGQHNSKETPIRLDTVFDLTGPGIEPKNFCANSCLYTTLIGWSHYYPRYSVHFRLPCFSKERYETKKGQKRKIYKLYFSLGFAITRNRNRRINFGPNLGTRRGVFFTSTSGGR